MVQVPAPIWTICFLRLSLPRRPPFNVRLLLPPSIQHTRRAHRDYTCFLSRPLTTPRGLLLEYPPPLLIPLPPNTPPQEYLAALTTSTLSAARTLSAAGVCPPPSLTANASPPTSTPAQPSNISKSTSPPPTPLSPGRWHPRAWWAPDNPPPP